MNKNLAPLGAALFVLAIVCYLLFYVYSLVHVHENCHDGGHVVKNIFDWPVCVH